MLSSERCRVLVLGATGFIGGHIFRELSGRLGVDATGIARRGANGIFGIDRFSEETLRLFIHEADVVIQSVSYVGSDPARSRAANVDVTALVCRLVAEVPATSLLYVSTCGIYGSGPHRNVKTDEVLPKPESVASSDRLFAEHLVMGVGGSIVRPHLVLGEGDKWVMPMVLNGGPALQEMINASSAMASTLSAEDLARACVDLSVRMADSSETGGNVWHATHPDPISVARLQQLASRITLDLPGHTHNREQPELSPHQLDMLNVDHWYNSEDLWESLGWKPRADPLKMSSAVMSWYRSTIR